jgi:hypothetical protein
MEVWIIHEPGQKSGGGGRGWIGMGIRKILGGSQKMSLNFTADLWIFWGLAAKISQKCHFGPNFPTVADNFFGLGGGSRLRVLLGVRGQG